MKQLIFTCGPASDDDLILKRMALMASGLRLNIAHLDKNRLEMWLNRLVTMRMTMESDFRIILDLQGAKVRIGEVPDSEFLPSVVELFLGEKSSHPDRIPVPCQSVFAQTSTGDRLLLNDRRVILKVISRSDDFLTAAVEQNGRLSSGKGLNSPDRVFEIARVTAADAAAIKISQDIENLDYAISFVADGRESELFRPLTGSHRLLAKIEQRAAFSHLPDISTRFDELWLCRGDLGAEAGLNRLGELQNNFAASIKTIEKPCLLAGEVLGSMVAMPQPSRAEIVQLHDAMQDGFAGIVLSDETASGRQVPAVLSFLQSFFA